MATPRQKKSRPSMASESREMVPKEELNKLKRKLEEMEAEQQRDKKKLKEAQAELENNSKKLEQFKALVATADIKFRPKRARISLTVPNIATSTDNRIIFSDPVEVAGFQWKLRQLRNNPRAWLSLCLCAFPPEHYRGPFQFELDCTFRLINTFTSKDIQKELNGCKMNENIYGIGAHYLAEIKDLMDPSKGFLREDGSVQVEVDFTVKTATLDHFLADPVPNDGDNVESNAE